jgi:hypothetical protein
MGLHQRPGPRCQGAANGLIETGSGGTWTATRAPLPPGTSGDPYSVLNTLSCGNTTALVDALANGSWTAIPVPLPPDSASPLNGFIWAADCTGSGFCAAAGGYYASDNTNQGLLVTSG